MNSSIATIAISVIIGAGIVFLYYTFKKFVENVKRNIKFRHGIDGELRAKRFMEDNGYKVLEYQPELNYEVLVNEDEYSIKVKPDYIVAKNGKVYVAEVKTGDYAPTINSKETRRQLLEYYFASEYDGILLVNMENRIIQNIVFPQKKNSNESNLRPLLIFCFICIVILVGLIIIKK